MPCAGTGLYLDVNNFLIGVAYIWISCEILRFVWTSEMVSRMKQHQETELSPITFHQRFMLVAHCFAVSFFFCGLTHWVHVMQGNDLIDDVIVLSKGIHSIAVVAGFATAYTLTTSIHNLLTATNGLVVTSEGRLIGAEATLLDVIDNCKESVAVLSLNELTFLRGNKSTCLYFGKSYQGAKILDFIHDDDRHIFSNCVAQLLTINGNSKRADEGTGNVPLRVLDGNFYQGFERKLTPLKLDVDEESPLLDENARAPQSTQVHRRSVVIEYRVCNPSHNNEILWLESTVLLHEESKRGNNGTITSTALMLLSRDVTDRNTERDLIRRENAAKLQYITCCAHDLKTPLQSFSSALDLLLSTELNADQKDICNQAEISLSLMNLTIAQTMDTSKALMGYDLVPKKSTCYISDLLTTVAVIIDSYGRQVPIYFTVAKNISNAIITDNEWVWQMLLNFLTNACKHTDNGSIHVNLSLCTELPAGKKSCGEVVARSPIPGHTRQLQNRTSMRKREAIEEQYKKESQKQQKLLFDIVDTGVGVEKGRHDSLFEVFSQAQAGQSTGTGLGLFSVYSRCERLGGACGLISPNTSSGDGSTFWFAIPYVTAGSKLIKSTDFSRYRTGHVMCRECLPASSIVMGIEVSWKEKKDVVDDDANRNGSCGDLSSSFKLNEDDSLLQGEVGAPCNFPLAAFVVDDSQSIRKLLQRTLLGMGFTRVEMFENGKRALDAMKKEVVDMVFMDIQMPIMSGPEAVRRLREFEKTEGNNRARQFVVAVSANIEDNVLGMDGFDIQHSKPMREKGIVECINVYVNEFCSNKNCQLDV